MGHSYIAARGPGQPRLVKSLQKLADSPDLTHVEAAVRNLGQFLEDNLGGRESDAESRIIVPTWVAWQSAKAEVASLAGVMDATVIDALDAFRAAEDGSAEKERARTRYDAELDRVIAASDLDEAVATVHATFFSE